eukprot:6325208-Alexandrium_andersonii.AAC.1
MSASLVGSEMCIRDSLRLGTQRAALHAHGATAVLVGLAPSPSGEGATVSYTHLTLPTICSV